MRFFLAPRVSFPGTLQEMRNLPAEEAKAKVFPGPFDFGKIC